MVSKLLLFHLHRRSGKPKKISKGVQEAFVGWLENHPDVVISPNQRDVILVKDENGVKQRVSKWLMQKSIREFHNDMLLPVEQGGFEHARDEEGKTLISDTMFRSLVPRQCCKMTDAHKIMCGCEVCISMGFLHTSLNAFRLRHQMRLHNRWHELVNHEHGSLFLPLD